MQTHTQVPVDTTLDWMSYHLGIQHNIQKCRRLHTKDWQGHMLQQSMMGVHSGSCKIHKESDSSLNLQDGRQFHHLPPPHTRLAQKDNIIESVSLISDCKLKFQMF